MSVEVMSPEDWPSVRSIYLEGIHGGDATFEMEVPSWDEWDQSHLPFARLIAAWRTVLSDGPRYAHFRHARAIEVSRR